KLELAVIHGRSTSYQTRVVVPIRLTPGKNEVNLGIDEMANVNGSAPDLQNVVRWYILDADRKAPTVYFSDIWLEGGELAAGPGPLIPAMPLPANPNVGYRIKGRIGNQEVDLTVTPFVLAGAPAAAGPRVQGDPARLERIRAARMPKVTRPVLFDTPEADAI